MAKLDTLVKPKTYIFIILDKSGSMSSIAEFAVNSYNEQLQEIRKNSLEQNISISLVEFNSSVEFVVYNQAAEETKDLSIEQYVPEAMTALNDAIGMSIDKVLQEPDIGDENTSVLFVIITDGAENGSKEYSREMIAKKIKDLQETNRWTFTYMGANVDPMEFANSYNVPVGNVTGFAFSADGMAAGSSKATRGLSSYLGTRSGSLSTGGNYLIGETMSTSFYSDIEENKDIKIAKE